MAKAIIGALKVILGIDSAEFTRGLKDATSRLTRVSDQMRNVGAQMTRNVTLPLVGIGTLAVKTGMDLEAAMNRVAAATGASGEQFAALRKAAIDMGRTTQFSATESADAIEILAKNGLSAAQILDGALAASLKLAAASGTDLAKAGDIATDVMASFGKQAADLEPVVDGISGVLLSSKFDIDDYRLALAQAGGVAGGLGVSLEDFNTTIASTSSAFASGSDAGTSFKTFLTRLKPETDGAAEAMAELGLEFFDAEGNMKSMADVAEELKVALEGLSDEQRIGALKKIFGVDAMRTAIGLAKQGAEGFNNMAAAIGAVSAQDQAEARMQGLSGEMKRLKSATESLLIAIADSGLLAAITNIVTGLADLVARLSEADPQLVQMGVTAAAVAAAIGPLVAGLGLVVAGVAALASPIGIAIAVLGTITTAVIVFKDEIVALIETLKRLVTEGIDYVAQKLQALDEALGGLGSGAVQSARNMAQGVGAEMAKLPGLMSPAQVAAAGVKTAFFELYDAVVGNSYVPDMVEGVEQWMGRLARSMPQAAREAAQGAASALSSVNSFAHDLGRSVAGNLESMFDSAIRGTFDLQSAIHQLAASIAQLGFRSLLGGLFGGFGGGGGFGQSFWTGIPFFASGTNFAPGGLAVVGEQGPELVNLPRGSQVVPNDEIGSMTPSFILLDDRAKLGEYLASLEGEGVVVDLMDRNGFIRA